MKQLLMGVVWIMCSMSAMGQRDIDEASKPSFAQRIYFGGGFGFSGGTSPNYGKYSYIGLYPIVGYMVNNRTSVGASITYQHYSYPDIGSSYDQYGISPFVRYNIGQVFAYSEYMILSSPTNDPNIPRKIYNRWLMGLGYRVPLGQRGSLNAMGLYDVLWKQYDPLFSSPWVFRVFVSI